MGKPAFYKIMTEDYTKKLKIPGPFLKYFKGVSARNRNCVLRSPVGRSWVIKLVEVDRCIFFDDGWENFVQDHPLEWGDFIVFTYDGSFEFRVNVFEKSGCEVDYAVVYANRTRKGGEKVSNNLTECNKNERIMSNSLGSRKQRKRNPTNEAASSKSNLYGKTLVKQEMEHDLPLEILDAVPEPSKKERVISQCLGSCKRRIKNPTIEAASSCKVAEKRDNRTACRDQQPKKVGVLQKHKAHGSRDCSFSVTLRASYISPRAYLHIPEDLCGSYFTENMEEVVLLVSHGNVSRRWVVKYISDRNVFSAGWSKFVQDNHLKADDVCSFEAVPRMVNTMNVVIHRK